VTRTTTQPPARARRLNIRLSQQEWDKVHKLSANSTCRSVSEYARKVLSEKPVKVFYRNQSFDEFEERMTQLLPLLEAFGENFSQLVKTRADLQPLLDSHRDFSKTAAAIKTHLEKLSDQCDPKL
jgi:chromatin segregation and condensation protein Rec8/ScpA/Scc1 (kleisin family)